ncbi:conjugal transfer protein TraB [Caballeronia sp. LZ001]|uniref:conjugal transfer protein TraB n=1 Tax=Caballeronia sp. LZ001 TaxID=3038553 RepID=UPI00285ECD2D|nr:conjugal transfer protein TraB [Caballeronia sp. LZ001]MDR5804912.1 conjugal transfer protein TraB [Caballeronia sp. LZ001]
MNQAIRRLSSSYAPRMWRFCRHLPVPAAVTGTAVACIAWYPGNHLIGLLALPAAWAISGSRQDALALFAFYYLAGARDIPVVTQRFFTGYGELGHDVALALGVGFWLLQAFALALPWVILKPPLRATAYDRACRSILATLLVSGPPLGIVGWLSPAHIASALYPGWQWAGMVLGLIALGVAATIRSAAKTWPVSLLMIVLSLYARGSNTQRQPPAGWIAVNTAFGRFDQSNYLSLYERTIRIQIAVKRAIDDGAQVVILPEEIVGLWRPAMSLWWHDDIERMRATGRTLVIGADLVVSSAPFHYTDSAVVTGAGYGRFDSRQPVPAALWRPWAEVSAIRGNIQQPDIVVAGRHAAFSLCYEDLLWWPHWRTLFIQPDVIISMSNDWFGPDLALPRIQQQSIESVARLAGTPLLRATNR